MTREAAIMLVETEWWKDATNDEIVAFQLYEDRLCMSFDRFQEAMQAVLGRPVYTHEFAWPQALREEREGKRPQRTLRDIIELIPEEKRLIVFVDRKEKVE